MICSDCARAADGVPGAEHCDEPAEPGRESWACTCQHKPAARRTDTPKEVNHA